jgi:hypothetical protein
MAITVEADPRPDEYIQLIHSSDGAYAAYDVTAPIRDTSLADPLRTTSRGKPDANPVMGSWGTENSVVPCDLGIFVDQAAEPILPQNPATSARCGRILAPGRRVLV